MSSYILAGWLSFHRGRRGWRSPPRLNAFFSLSWLFFTTVTRATGHRLRPRRLLRPATSRRRRHQPRHASLPPSHQRMN